MKYSLSLVLALVSAPSALLPSEAPSGGSGWFTDGPLTACGFHTSPSFNSWTFWFKGSQKNSDPEKYHLWGANGIWSTGEHTGNAYIVLGPTSAGVVAMCKIGYTPGMTVRVEEEFKLPNGGTFWIQIWNPGEINDWTAYGYRFKGYAIRRIRMSISNFAGGTFFWGGAY